MAEQSGRLEVGLAKDIPPGERRLVEHGERGIGVFNIGGEFVAALNVCPHELAPVCRGRVTGTTLPSPPGEYDWGRDGEILSCPWHGWEFDLRTGRALADNRRRLRMFPTEVVDGVVFVLV